MIYLKSIGAQNYHDVAGLRISEEQSEFVPPAVNIMARAYAWRDKNSCAYAISDDEKVIGVLLVYEEDDSYVLSQFLIDLNHQNKGYGKQALKLLIERLSKENKFDHITLSVIKKNAAAIHLYKSIGFTDAGYMDPQKPNSYILLYRLK